MCVLQKCEGILNEIEHWIHIKKNHFFKTNVGSISIVRVCPEQPQYDTVRNRAI